MHSSQEQVCNLPLMFTGNIFQLANFKVQVANLNLQEVKLQNSWLIISKKPNKSSSQDLQVSTY